MRAILGTIFVIVLFVFCFSNQSRAGDYDLRVSDLETGSAYDFKGINFDSKTSALKKSFSSPAIDSFVLDGRSQKIETAFLLDFSEIVFESGGEISKVTVKL